MTLTVEKIAEQLGHDWEKGNFEVGKGICISRNRAWMNGRIVEMTEKAIKVKGNDSGKTAWLPKSVLKIENGPAGYVDCVLNGRFNLQSPAFWLWNEESRGC